MSLLRRLKVQRSLRPDNWVSVLALWLLAMAIAVLGWLGNMFLRAGVNQ